MFEYVSAIEELRLRRWARLNYVRPSERSPWLGSVVLDEMEAMDRDGRPRTESTTRLVGIEKAARPDFPIHFDAQNLCSVYAEAGSCEYSESV